MMDKIASAPLIGPQHPLLKEMANIANAAATGIHAPVMAPSLAIAQPGSTDFARVMHQAVNSVNQLQQSAAAQQQAVEMGLSDDMAGAMLESQKASIAFSAMTQVRNKLTRALDDIMNTPM